MDLFQALILGIAQGITEWLPVSSSGHLVILQELFGLKSMLTFDVLLHLATLLVIFIIFRRDIINLAKDKKQLKFLAIGTIPIAILGYFLYDFIESLFSNLLAVSISLIIFGVFLFFTKKQGNNELSNKNSLIIGIAQAIALLPGISRSGSTIGTALILKIKKEKAIAFSFLLAMPAILGASILEITKNNFVFEPVMLVGFIAAFITGYLTLKLLINIIKRGRFYLFGYYCLILGIIILTWTLI